MAVVYIMEVEVNGESSLRSMSFGRLLVLYLESNVDIYVSEPPNKFAFILII
jgi:hypothetical protein